MRIMLNQRCFSGTPSTSPIVCIPFCASLIMSPENRLLQLFICFLKHAPSLFIYLKYENCYSVCVLKCLFCLIITSFAQGISPGITSCISSQFTCVWVHMWVNIKVYAGFK